MKHILLCLCCLLSLSAWADEGMWMLGRLDKQTRRSMKELGLSLSPDKLYHPKKMVWCLPTIIADSVPSVSTPQWSTTT